jgi:hypothetical protein
VAGGGAVGVEGIVAHPRPGDETARCNHLGLMSGNGPPVLALVPTILTAAFVATIWPAESAVHGSLVEALEYE